MTKLAAEGKEWAEWIENPLRMEYDGVRTFKGSKAGKGSYQKDETGQVQEILI